MSSRFHQMVLLAAPLILLASSALLADTLVPEENRTKGDAPPAFDSAENSAKILLEAIKAGDPHLAADFFFPSTAFDLVKAIANPGRYHKKLVKWYEEDILAEHPRFKDPSWAFEKIEWGRCKWQEKGTEGNSLPYWSCRGNRVTATSGELKRSFEIHVMINWGTSWYITHLGKIRK